METNNHQDLDVVLKEKSMFFRPKPQSEGKEMREHLKYVSQIMKNISHNGNKCHLAWNSFCLTVVSTFVRLDHAKVLDKLIMLLS